MEGELESMPISEVPPVNYTSMLNIPYGSDPLDVRNHMDIFVPSNLDTSKENGAFLFIYGGGWASGDKESFHSFAHPYADAGYGSVVINMHNALFDQEVMSAEITAYDMLNDIHNSVIKLIELSDEHGWNITQLAIYGGSSGGNLAMLYGYSRGTEMPYFNAEEILPVKFVVTLVGPINMHDSAWGGAEDWEDAAVVAAFGAGEKHAMFLTAAVNNPDLTEEEKENYINSMSPVYYVEKYGGAPTVSGYAKRDQAQNPHNGKILKGYLDKKSVRNDLITFPNSNHNFDNDPVEAKAFFDKSIEYAEIYFNEKN